MKRENRKRAYEKTEGQKDKALNQSGREKERKKKEKRGGKRGKEGSRRTEKERGERKRKRKRKAAYACIMRCKPKKEQTEERQE